MNDNENKVCTKIFQTIINNPLSRLFWTDQSDVVNSNIQHPVNLEYISIRLFKEKYTRAADFIFDLNLCLNNGKNGSVKGTIKYAAAQELLMIFENLVANLQPLAHPNTLPLRFFTSEFEEENALPEASIMSNENNDEGTHSPQSEIFQMNSDPNDLVTLLRDIKLLTSTDLTMKLAVLVKNLQPNAITLSNTLSFNVGLMTEETRIAVRSYVTELLHDAASGKIDPFARPFGTKVDPIKIQERGIFLRTSRIDPIPHQDQPQSQILNEKQEH
ncbi:hypothetical protein M9Y10_001152 [Tritrichomonas musculus]|uniref:Bromo domain-containing protein n=1 Tax=Tritrichomonas musculus TaxID=1915356 RepID=A0ABR2L684_9EUKA